MSIGEVRMGVGSRKAGVRVTIQEENLIDVGRGLRPVLITGEIVDISLGGFKFKSGYKELKVGNRVIYRFINRISNHFITGEIVWMVEDEGYGVYGIKFIDLDDRLIDSFITYMQGLLEKQ